jgi:hypothetical protein
MDIQGLRRRYPQYDHLPDLIFIGRLHRKMGTDIPFETFAEDLGLKIFKPPPPGPKVTPEDLAEIEKEMDVRGAKKAEGYQSLLSTAQGLFEVVGKQPKVTMTVYKRR